MTFTIFHFFRKNEKTPETLDFTGFSGGVFGVPEVIRTPDLPLRRRSLYPAELRRHAAFFPIFYIIVEVAGKCNANSDKVRKAWFHLLYKVCNRGI